jgi:hypothetical protein
MTQQTETIWKFWCERAIRTMYFVWNEESSNLVVRGFNIGSVPWSKFFPNSKGDIDRYFRIEFNLMNQEELEFTRDWWRECCEAFGSKPLTLTPKEYMDEVTEKMVKYTPIAHLAFNHEEKKVSR